MTQTFFISDLHLQANNPQTIAQFAHFLQTLPDGTDALYILGDLFEFWIGDDAAPAEAEQLAALMASVPARGIPLYFMHGNRDFLVGQDFAAQSGFEILPDPYCFELYGRPTLLTHGDLLCTEDRDYLAFRAQARNAAFQQQFLSQPIPERLQIAQNLRTESASQGMQKSMEIMDATVAEVQRLLDSHQVEWMIHGHTHRPGIQLFPDTAQTRITLSDWDGFGNCLEVDANGSYTLRNF